MLYMVGALAFDTMPFNVDGVSRKSGADLATKAVIGGLKPSEFMGPGDDTITLSGQLLPTKIGGLTQLELARQMQNMGTRVPVMRGDGVMLGTFAIVSIDERHSDLMHNGVPFVLKYKMTLKKVQPDIGAGQQVISGLLSLFGGL